MSSKYSYPEFYYSERVRDLLSSKPALPLAPTPPSEPLKPVDPGEYDSGGNLGCLLVMLVASIILFIAGMSSDIENKGSMIIPGIIPILFSFFLLKTTRWDKEGHEKEKRNYSKALQDYPLLQAQYQKDYEEYLKQKEAYDRRVQSLLTKTNILRFRKSIIQDWKSTRSLPKFQPCKGTDLIKKGVSEHYFAEALKRSGFEVHTNQKIPAEYMYYYPDFLVVKDNIYIDIEIDEPYSGQDGTPIHYLEIKGGIKKSVDSERNNYLTEKGFEVIRFSEDQVILRPQECINFITLFIKNINNGSKSMSCPEEFKSKKWTKEEASQMAYQRFRNTYLPINLQNSISSEGSYYYSDSHTELLKGKLTNNKKLMANLVSARLRRVQIMSPDEYNISNSRILVLFLRIGKPIQLLVDESFDRLPVMKIDPSLIEIIDAVEYNGKRTYVAKYLRE